MDPSNMPEERILVLAVCAMEKKSKSKQMTELLSKLQEFPRLKIIVISEKMILEDDVNDWPRCDSLIAFYSTGFPLDKALAYAKIHQPLLINDIEKQQILMDRRKVYKTLKKIGVPVPRYMFGSAENMIEFDDHITIGETEFHKPFVEKPVSGEDHNVYMYFPSAAGGGSQRLFRKTNDKSSEYSPESQVRKDGEFLYEDFIPTDGCDVKVYTVGPHYAHAEARKAPGLDGKVCRDACGKEQRYPVILTPAEKLISRKVCLAFKQTVCGFDLLRANGKSYVCDVNGFSFVKTGGRYYHDASRILAQMIFRHFRIPIKYPPSYFTPMVRPLLSQPPAQSMELRCVVAVIRHGDRTPKQKIKLQTSHPNFEEIFKKNGGSKKQPVKLKTPYELQEVLDIVRSVLLKDETHNRDKFEQMRFVLEMKGGFNGINRKVELKSGQKSQGENCVDVVLKWGGELTGTGRKQAQTLGQSFRHLYPLGQNPKGIGLLRLHSTFRHDLKIYASDEARVQMTAAAFVKGFLALDGELPPILAHMVNTSSTNGLLIPSSQAHELQKPIKAKLFQLLREDREWDDNDKTEINPCASVSVGLAMDRVRNPKKLCDEISDCLQKLLALIGEKRTSGRIEPLYHWETWDFLHRRWRKLYRDFKPENDCYDLSKVPDIYDAIKYDLLHNKDAIGFEEATNLCTKVNDLSDIIMPQENGATKEEKIKVGLAICNPLLKKIKGDLQNNQPEEDTIQPDSDYSLGIPERQVRTRVYFTSGNTMHGLLQVFLYASPWSGSPQWSEAMEYCSKVSELDFLSQIVILVYEDSSKDVSCEARWHVEIHFSPGVSRVSTGQVLDWDISKTTTNNGTSESQNLIPWIQPLKALHSGLSYNELDDFLQHITS